jgi:hypothetical protein
LTKTKSITVLAILALLIAAGAALFSTSRGLPRVVASASGHIVKLEAWHFKAASVRYDLSDRPWARRLEQWLPDRLRRTLGLPQAVVSVVVTPDFQGEPVLSAAFSISEPPGTPRVGGLRLIVSDDGGEEFDPAVQNANVQSGHWVAAVQAFPRRGNELSLRLMADYGSLGEIKIKNPARGSHPKWQPETMPVSVNTNGLELSLVKFRSYQPGTTAFTKSGVYPRTECAFRVRENGRESTAWRPLFFEISDATGNHWRPWRDSRLECVSGKELLAGFLGALWPGEDAWKVHVEFKRIAEFPENELLRTDPIPVPGLDELLQPQSLYEVNGATVEVAAVIGSNVGWNRIRQFNPHRFRVAGCFTVLIKGRIASQGRHLAFVEAKDEHGRVLPLEKVPNEGEVADRGQVSGQSPDFLPYSFNFKTPQNAREFTLVLGVSQSVQADFLAKPEQVRDVGNPQ